MSSPSPLPRSILSHTIRLQTTLTWLLLLASAAGAAAEQPGGLDVQDMWGRSLKKAGVTLVDWEGHLANPAVRLTLRPPANAAFPVTFRVAADGQRLYLDDLGTPSTVGRDGPRKTVTAADRDSRPAVYLAIFPDRDGKDEDYTLTVTCTDARGTEQTLRVPIHVIDQDREHPEPPPFKITVDFSQDKTGFFKDARARAIVQQAADDWAYFFDGMDLDPVPAGDDDWWKSANLGDELNDLYSIVHHEIGHALIFNPAYPRLAQFKQAGAVDDAAVQAYLGAAAKIDRADHLDGTVDPASRRGAFGYEYHGDMPRRRWLITKQDLLVAQAVGYRLRQTSAFEPLAAKAERTPGGTVGKPYRATLTIRGGLPAYYCSIAAGTLPPGLALDSFTGTFTGVPGAAGTFTLTVQVQDDPKSKGVSVPLRIEVSES